MLTKRKFGDRRGRPRFEIVGDLPGTLQMEAPMPLRNIGRGGAMFESRLSLPVDSLHNVRLAFEDDESETQVRVRHLSRIPGPGGDDRFLIGIEFIALPPVLLGHIDRWVALSNGYSSAGGGVT